jgi:phosphate transport system protein
VAVDYLEAELGRLRAEVVELGRSIEKALLQSVDVYQPGAFTEVRAQAAKVEPLITLDHQVAKRRFAIEMDCLALSVTQQPEDGELRAITSMLESITELEHIGGYVTEIARIQYTLARLDEPLLGLLTEVQYMAERAQDMMAHGLDAFWEQDEVLARCVHHSDSEIDDLYAQLYRRLLSFMKGKSRAPIKQARYLAQIAHNLERTADRVTNICEWVVFAVTGELNAMNQAFADQVQREVMR